EGWRNTYWLIIVAVSTTVIPGNITSALKDNSKIVAKAANGACSMAAIIAAMPNKAYKPAGESPGTKAPAKPPAHTPSTNIGAIWPPGTPRPIAAAVAMSLAAKITSNQLQGISL